MKLAYEIIGILLAICAVTVGVLGMPEVMAVSAGLAVLLLLVGNSDKIARVKAGTSGIEAETRAVIAEARVTIEQLRLIAKIAAQTSLSMVVRSGRWGGYNDDEKAFARSNTLAILTQLGVDQTEQNGLLREWHDFTKFDYALLILGGSQLP